MKLVLYVMLCWPFKIFSHLRSLCFANETFLVAYIGNYLGVLSKFRKTKILFDVQGIANFIALSDGMSASPYVYTSFRTPAY